MPHHRSLLSSRLLEFFAKHIVRRTGISPYGKISGKTIETGKTER
jgi:hypothetical protein